MDRSKVEVIVEEFTLHKWFNVIRQTAYLVFSQVPSGIFYWPFQGSSSDAILLSCASVVYSTDRSKVVVPVLVLLFVALWFILRGDLFYVLPCVILFLCFSVLLALQLPRLGKRELIFVLFLRLFDLRLFGFVCFLFLLVSGKGCGLGLWHSLDFSLTFVFHMLHLFYHYLFLISPSFGGSGR